jgi:beta-glucanase (GH16 family)
VNTALWNYRTDTKALSAQLPANVSVFDGHLNIATLKQDFDGQSYTGGGIVSKLKFRYGYYQVQSKITANPGWHASFWLMEGDGRTTWDPGAYTEIDGYEINSDHPESISAGILEWSQKKNFGSVRCNADYHPGFSTADTMHVYGIEWTEESVTYYLDRKPFCTQPYPPTAHPHDLLNIWLTAIGYNRGISVANNPSPVVFANLQVFVRDYYIRNGETGYAEYGSGWADSPLLGYSNLGSRYSRDKNAFATWTKTILAAGNYDVQIYKVVHPGSDPKEQITVNCNSGQSQETLDFTSGTDGWVDLGTFKFAAGSSGYVKAASSETGIVRANVVKFLRR